MPEEINEITERIQSILSQVSPISSRTAQILTEMTTVKIERGFEHLLKEGEKAEYEFFVLNGIVRSYVLNSYGEEITMNVYTSNKPVTPSLLRTINRKSYINLEIISKEAEIMCFEIDGMEKRMQNAKDLRSFGHTLVMHDSLFRAEREMVLAKKKGIEKLKWFRDRFDGLENEISHQYIASFLGMTPTSLSRLRGSGD